MLKSLAAEVVLVESWYGCASITLVEKVDDVADVGLVDEDDQLAEEKKRSSYSSSNQNRIHYHQTRHRQYFSKLHVRL